MIGKLQPGKLSVCTQHHCRELALMGIGVKEKRSLKEYNNKAYVKFALGSIPGRVIPKTFKMVFGTSLLNTRQYKLGIKGKVRQSR